LVFLTRSEESYVRHASEFQNILDYLLGEDKRGTAESPAGAASQTRVSPQDFSREDWISKLSFGQGPFRAAAFGAKTYKKKIKEPVRESANESNQEPAKFVGDSQSLNHRQPNPQPPAPEPPPRVRRKFTKDQDLATRVFAKYGETIDDFSTQDEIKTAYRRLARRYHPDSGFKSEGPFKAISQAYRKLVC
jgi:hypothetical protein